MSKMKLQESPRTLEKGRARGDAEASLARFAPHRIERACYQARDAQSHGYARLLEPYTGGMPERNTRNHVLAGRKPAEGPIQSPPGALLIEFESTDVDGI